MVRVNWGRFVSTTVAALVAGVLASQAQAQTVGQLLSDTLAKNEKVLAAKADSESAAQRVKESWGGWYPQFLATADNGFESDVKPGATLSHQTRQASLSLTQTLWDFGATNAVIDKAKLGHEQAGVTLDATRQGVTLEAVTAYINLLRAYEVLAFAKQSEENIRHQTGLEEARVQAGSGLSTDVLQAKAQFAGAQSRRVLAEGVLQTAMNRFHNVFKMDPLPRQSMTWPRDPSDLVPNSVDSAIDTGLNDNLQLKVAALTAESARETVQLTSAKSFYPLIQAKAEMARKEDVAGTAGLERDNSIKVMATFPFNTGFTAINTLNAAKSDLSSVEYRVVDARKTVEESVHNSWNQLQIYRANAMALRNQATLAGEFLTLARRERQLGNRSLLDVLSGETTVINANSDAVSAQADVAIAAYTLLAAMGQLKESSLQ